ncbi:hypothetical protein C7M84_000257 [Penaeus vannamei]|uniref:Uncharacterized protein n=1 Tax=Penaeus vannamei TaxID=6689 RepID=A0A3R7PBL2_PENVA|nr:hypothetical protein C7M84_000257 [Penaeus vannamei]
MPFSPSFPSPVLFLLSPPPSISHSLCSPSVTPDMERMRVACCIYRRSLPPLLLFHLPFSLSFPSPVPFLLPPSIPVLSALLPSLPTSSSCACGLLSIPVLSPASCISHSLYPSHLPRPPSHLPFPPSSPPSSISFLLLSPFPLLSFRNRELVCVACSFPSPSSLRPLLSPIPSILLHLPFPPSSSVFHSLHLSPPSSSPSFSSPSTPSSLPTFHPFPPSIPVHSLLSFLLLSPFELVCVASCLAKSHSPLRLLLSPFSPSSSISHSLHPPPSSFHLPFPPSSLLHLSFYPIPSALLPPFSPFELVCVASCLAKISSLSVLFYLPFSPPSSILPSLLSPSSFYPHSLCSPSSSFYPHSLCSPSVTPDIESLCMCYSFPSSPLSSFLFYFPFSPPSSILPSLLSPSSFHLPFPPSSLLPPSIPVPSLLSTHFHPLPPSIPVRARVCGLLSCEISLPSPSSSISHSLHPPLSFHPLPPSIPVPSALLPSLPTSRACVCGLLLPISLFSPSSSISHSLHPPPSPIPSLLSFLLPLSIPSLLSPSSSFYPHSLPPLLPPSIPARARVCGLLSCEISLVTVAIYEAEGGGMNHSPMVLERARVARGVTSCNGESCTSPPANCING